MPKRQVGGDGVPIPWDQQKIADDDAKSRAAVEKDATWHRNQADRQRRGPERSRNYDRADNHDAAADSIQETGVSGALFNKNWRRKR